MLITGGNGMLGKSLKLFLSNVKYLNGKSDLDLSNLSEIYKLDYYDTIIHCAAYTDLNYCDNNPEQSYNLHAESVKILQSKCNKLIYISTNPTDSQRIYYKSKQLGEKYTLNRDNDLVVRTNIYGNGGLAKWALDNLNQGNKINGYSNVIFNPVSTLQLADFLTNHSQNCNGIVNVGSSSTITKYDFVKILALKYGIDPSLISPLEIKGDLDLRIPLTNQYFVYNLLDGIETISYE